MTLFKHLSFNFTFGLPTTPFIIYYFFATTLNGFVLTKSTASFNVPVNNIYTKIASYSLPQNSYINITLKYCFDEKIYDINKVDTILFAVSGKQIKE